MCGEVAEFSLEEWLRNKGLAADFASKDWKLRAEPRGAVPQEPIARSRSNNVVEERKIITHPVRRVVLQALGLAEDIVYAGIGLMLAISALSLLAIVLKSIVGALSAHALSREVVQVLDEILLILLIVELLYTVQVSFREHGLIAEPFLVVALIAVIRRVLVLTAEFPKLPDLGGAVFTHAVIELALLIVMIFVLVVSLIMLQKHTRQRSSSADEGAGS
jgi:hypothetical protein